MNVSKWVAVLLETPGCVLAVASAGVLILAAVSRCSAESGNWCDGGRPQRFSPAIIQPRLLATAETRNPAFSMSAAADSRLYLASAGAEKRSYKSPTIETGPVPKL
jgi:hypothetical protein